MGKKKTALMDNDRKMRSETFKLLEALKVKIFIIKSFFSPYFVARFKF